MGVGEKTARRYRMYIREFSVFSKLSPRQLISLAISDKIAAKEKLVEFYQYYVQRGYAPNTCRNAFLSVRSFLNYNEIRFGRFPFTYHTDPIYETRRIFTRAEVFRMLLGARTPRDKALISFIIQSAQRIGIITNLRYGAVRRQIENLISPVIIDNNAEVTKRHVSHSFAIGQECVDLVKIMIDHRQRSGEMIDDESFLFRSYFRGWDMLDGVMVGGGKSQESDRGNPLNNTSVGAIMRTAAASGGVPINNLNPNPTDHSRNRYEIHAHAFRRWWKNMMRRGGVSDPLFLDFILGHRAPYRGAYDFYDHDYIRHEYAKAEPQLTFLRNRADLAQGREEMEFQKIVDESEAQALLSEGWRFVTTLPSGRLVVERIPAK